MNNDKPKETTEGLITLLERKGITFKNHSQEEVIEFLERRNYYYRISSYRKNFKKDSITQKYHDCDFFSLVDISSIDLYLREFLLSLCLDIEHSIKTELMRLFTIDHNEDGYSFVNEFKLKHPQGYSNLMQGFSNNKYLRDMFNKRKDVSIWVLLEIVDFGQLCKIVDLYNSDHSNKNMQQNGKLLRFVKNIRNTCAHNNIYLINLYNQNYYINRPSTRVVSLADTIGIDKSILHYHKLHDIVVLFYLYDNLCSNTLKNRRYKEGLRVINRFKKNEEKCPLPISLEGFYKLLTVLLDTIKE